jgi:hypothetical protein
MRAGKKDGYKEAGHDFNFKLTKSVTRPIKADFEHMTDLSEVKKNFRDADGSVKTQPRNFLVCPPKQGQIGKG